jgi:hypothetical protein
MSDFRKVSNSNEQESVEVTVSSAIDLTDGTFGITTSNCSTWPTECDFITYELDAEGRIDETSRVVWYGNRTSDTYIIARKVGGNATAITTAGSFATTVPTHYWANSLVEGIEKRLPDDGRDGIFAKDGRVVNFIVSSSPQAPIPGVDLIVFTPIV